MDRRWLLAAVLLIGACASGDRLTEERMACLGETPAPGCAAIYERDLGLAIPAASGAAPAAYPGTASGTRQRRQPAGPAVCSMAGQSYPAGRSTRREVTGDIRGVGMVYPRPGDGLPRQQTCTCQPRPGGGASWSCR